MGLSNKNKSQLSQCVRKKSKFLFKTARLYYCSAAAAQKNSLWDVLIANIHGAISDGGLGIPSHLWYAPMPRLRRLDRIWTEPRLGPLQGGPHRKTGWSPGFSDIL